MTDYAATETSTGTQGMSLSYCKRTFRDRAWIGKLRPTIAVQPEILNGNNAKINWTLLKLLSRQ